MTKGNLTREQAVTIVGAEVIAKLDKINCEPTDRVMTDNDTRVEFVSSIEAEGLNGEAYAVTAYYYQEQSDLDGLDDLGCLDWTITGYEIA